MQELPQWSVGSTFQNGPFELTPARSLVQPPIETREKGHNRRRSYIRRARKLVRKKMQREGLLPMKPRVAPGKCDPARSSIVEEGS